MPEQTPRIDVAPLSGAPDEADPDASRITKILDEIPEAWERAQESIEQARRRDVAAL